MKQIEIAEQIARDASCAQGEFRHRVLAIAPYLTDIAARNAALEAAHVQMQASLDAMAKERDRLREALEPLAKIGLWRDHYSDGPERLTNQSLGRLFTVEQVREARKLTAYQQSSPETKK
jgi:hypothetical protein